MPDYAAALPALDYQTSQSLTATGGTLTSQADDTNAQNESNLISTLNAAGTASDKSYTNAYLLSRNQTVSDLASQITAMNKRASAGRDTFQRQGEINEWEAQNKLDTLFFFQILFLFFTVAVVLLYFRQQGTLPSGAVYIVLGVLLIIVIGVFWNRATYTGKSRDKRFWNRRFIGLQDSGGLSSKLQCTLS
jgi:hypothetical protein